MPDNSQLAGRILGRAGDHLPAFRHLPASNLRAEGKKGVLVSMQIGSGSIGPLTRDVNFVEKAQTSLSADTRWKSCYGSSRGN